MRYGVEICRMDDYGVFVRIGTVDEKGRLVYREFAEFQLSGSGKPSVSMPSIVSTDSATARRRIRAYTLAAGLCESVERLIGDQTVNPDVMREVRDEVEAFMARYGLGVI